MRQEACTKVSDSCKQAWRKHQQLLLVCDDIRIREDRFGIEEVIDLIL